MGGVDQLDNISNYRTNARGQKWYSSIIMWHVDMTVNNAWILARCYGCTMDSLEFRRQLVEKLLFNHGEAPLKDMGSSCKSAVPLTSGQHYLAPNQKWLRCRVCGSQTMKICASCRVSLHEKCFPLFYNHKYQVYIII